MCLMEFRHQGLKRLAEQDDPSRLPPEMLGRITRIVAQHRGCTLSERHGSARCTLYTH